jgi:HEAT repeat protein
MEDIDLLVKALLDAEQNNVEALVKLSQSANPRIVDLLIDALSNPDPIIRSKAIWGLQQTRDLRVVDTLIQCLDDPDSEVRWSAVHVLLIFNDSRVVEPIIQKLSDPESKVRLAAVRSLGDLKDARAVASLVYLLQDAGLGITDLGITEYVIEALVKIRDSRSIEPITRMLKHEHAGMRSTAVEALGEFQDVRAIDALTEALSDWSNEGQRVERFEGIVFPSVCHYAAESLEKIGTPEALEIVQKWRSTPYPKGGLILPKKPQ